MDERMRRRKKLIVSWFSLSKLKIRSFHLSHSRFAAFEIAITKEKFRSNSLALGADSKNSCVFWAHIVFDRNWKLLLCVKIKIRTPNAIRLFSTLRCLCFRLWATMRITKKMKQHLVASVDRTNLICADFLLLASFYVQLFTINITRRSNCSFARWIAAKIAYLDREWKSFPFWSNRESRRFHQMSICFVKSVQENAAIFQARMKSSI